MNHSKKIIVNTTIVYVQLLINSVIGLIVIKYLLQSLGTEDYGIYMLVGGVVVMLNVLTTTMSNTAMRYLSHNLGKSDLEVSEKIFNNTLFIHFILGLVLVVVLELAGYLMFEFVFNIPNIKMFDAKLVYQFMILTAFISIISVPYDAVINSHENLLFLSVVSIIDYILRLFIVLFLLKYDGNRLVLYGFFTMIISIFMRLIKQFYSIKRYPECKTKIRQHKDTGLVKEMLSFTGWKLFGDFAVVMQTQMRGVLMNFSFGTIYNAGEGVAVRVKSQVNMVSVGITRAITPQINISEGAGNRHRMINLTLIGVKYTTFMYGLISIPLLLETNFIFKVWLGEIPIMAVLFCQLSFIIQYIDKLTWQIGNAIMAIGQIKRYQIMSGALPLIGVIISFVLLYNGGGVLILYYVTIVFSLIIGIMRLYFGKIVAGIKPIIFIKKTTLPVLIPMVAALLPSLFLLYHFEEGWFRLLLVFVSYIGTNSLLFYIFLNSSEKSRFASIFSSLSNRIK